ncbi:MAG: uracil-DNA glycosylase, partial [Clostridiales Family XIII bacterium]|nr:uracil-DNA glycosylase [Clostridiales Family XIII bacterium]
ADYGSQRIYPDMHDIFNAFRYTAYSDTRVVILGQDPYHGPGQAHGLCFSVRQGIDKPPSLQNIFKELYQELHGETGFEIPKDGWLVPWAERGVLLLNTVLTVRAGSANSHKGKGWERLTDRAIELLGERGEPMVFLLWGANARAKKGLLTNPRHLVLEAPHPSPLSAHNGFFGCGHFRKANDFLLANGAEAVDWGLG